MHGLQSYVRHVMQPGYDGRGVQFVADGRRAAEANPGVIRASPGKDEKTLTVLVG